MPHVLVHYLILESIIASRGYSSILGSSEASLGYGATRLYMGWGFYGM